MSSPLETLRVGIPAVLPPHPGLDDSVPHAPARPVKLSRAERVLALTNVLRYFPADQHATMLPELAEELRTLGHIYCHRLRPVAYPMKAHPLDAYPAACTQAASIMLMIQNNLDPAVAQFPHELITYGGNGSVFSNWAQYALVMRYLSQMSDEQTLVLYSGHPLGLFPSSKDAPRVIITNGMVVPNYSSRAMYERMYATGVTQYGQMTAGSFAYIGPQGIVHGTTITILSAARKRQANAASRGVVACDGGVAREPSLGGLVYLSSGLGGMSGAQPKAARIAGCVGVIAEVDGAALHKRHTQGWVDEIVSDVHECIRRIRSAKSRRECVSIGFHGNVVALWEALALTDELLVDLGSDQTSLHNPYLGGYYPVELTFEEARVMMREDPPRFKTLVQSSLRRHVNAVNTLAQRGMRFWDYGNAFLIEAYRAGAEVLAEGCTDAPDAGGKFRYPSYVQDIMGDIFSLGFGPFRWVCTSGNEADLRATDAIAADVFKRLMQHAQPESAQCYADNLTWIEAAFENGLVVGSQARILYSDCEGREALALAFNDAVRSGRISAPIVLSRDHHDVSGTDSPYRETSNIYDGSQFTADMAVHNVIGDAARGATWVSLHNGGGVGWGEVINGGFGLVLDGSADASRRAHSMLAWDVSNGVARRSWAGNDNARLTIAREMGRQSGLTVTVPVVADRHLVEAHVDQLDQQDASAERAQAVGLQPLGSPHAVTIGGEQARRIKVLLVNCQVATMAAASSATSETSATPFGLIANGAIGVAFDGKIALVCSMSELPASTRKAANEVRDMRGGLVTPGLIDCHTHIVYAGAEVRTREWDLKLSGASYETIARSGGGIAATVNETRAADVSSLVSEAAARVAALMRDGVTTLEIKSGYGLDRATEQRQLEAAGALAEYRCRVVRTYLGAHGVPAEFKGRADEYIDQVVLPTMDALKRAALIDAVDAFCEPAIALDAEQTARVLKHAAALGLHRRLHGDQLSDSGSAALAARLGALSCDHCEHTSAAGAAAMAEAGTVAVLLPASNVFMNETVIPPIAAFRAAGVRMAVATNCNPGSSPCTSITLAMHLACSRFRLSPEEALAGVTRHAAAALGLADQIGTIEVGKAADLACWSCRCPADLCYNMGLPQLVTTFIGGSEPWPVLSPPPGMAPPAHLPSSAIAQPPAYPVQTESQPASTGQHLPNADLRLGSLIEHVGSSTPCPAARPGKASIAIIGFPFDEGCARNGGRRGACDGPNAFRERLARIGVTPCPLTRVDIAQHVAIVDLGDVEGASLEEAHGALRSRVREALAAGHTPFVIGGGNDQSYSNARALLDVVDDSGTAARAMSTGSQRPGDTTAGPPMIGVMNVDAHLDVRPLIKGRSHSGSPFRELLEDADFTRLRGKFVEFAAQPMQCSLEHADFVREKDGTVMWHTDDPSQPSTSPAAFSEALASLGANKFVSFDVDSIRAADMPAVSCPSPIGLSAADALQMCAKAGACPAVRLMDVSEFNPQTVSRGDAYRSAKLVAFMFYRFALGRAVERATAVKK